MVGHVENGRAVIVVTVMIGSILVGVGVDFSIHIATRIRELGGGIQAIRSAAVGTGMSSEAAVVTCWACSLHTIFRFRKSRRSSRLSLFCSGLLLPCLILLPAIFITLEKMGIGAVSGSNNMAKKLDTDPTASVSEDVMEAALIDDVVDAW